MIYLLGASGTLGLALKSNLHPNQYIIVPRSEYLAWENSEHFRLFLAQQHISEDDSFFVSCGITNPNYKESEIRSVNYIIPRTILTESQSVGFNVVTFGSVFEEERTDNPYYLSKNLLFQFLRTIKERSRSSHFQMHTLYGSKSPSNHLFLGMILNSILTKTEFQMSSGLQLREYWHVSNVVKYVLSRFEQASTTGITRVTSGKPIQLRELARQIFDHFDLRELLAINALPTSPHENYGRLFLPEDADIAHLMRDPIPGVIAFLEDLVKGESDGQSE